MGSRSFVSLWENAIKWSAAGEGVSHHFRRWWMRAASARGHAEWLLKEQEIMAGKRQHIDKQRLIPPASIGQYDNDCGIFSLLVLTEPNRRPFIDPKTGQLGHDLRGPAYTDDDFDTNYNIAHTLAHERQNDAFGWPQSSTLYGAPVREPFRCQ